MLLLNFINQNYFRSSFPKGVEYNCCRNRHEEEHIQEDKNDEKGVDPN